MLDPLDEQIPSYKDNAISEPARLMCVVLRRSSKQEQRLTKSLVPGARSAGTAGVQYHAGQAEPWGFASLALCF